jgi:hypothetical protein
MICFIMGKVVTLLSLDYMDKYVNDKVYFAVASKTSTPVDEVRQVMQHIGNTIKTVIENDDVNVSVKLDYIGNIYSNPERRKIITTKKEKKDGLTNIGG